MSVQRLRISFVLASVALIALLCGGTATASPLLDTWAILPGTAATYQEAPTPDGTVHKSTTKEIPEGIEAVKRKELKYGTGVIRNGAPEKGVANVFTPVDPSGEVAIYAPPTDTLDRQGPSIQMDKGEMAGMDATMINAMLRAGKTVIVTDAYGNHGVRHYAGELNGVRMWNAVLAYRNDNPNECDDAPVDAYGFSGGGIDVANLLEYRWSRIRTGIIDSGPTDLGGFLRDPEAKNGLGLVAAAGALEPMAYEQKVVIWPRVRPTFQVAVKVLGVASQLVPIPGLVTTVVTIGGALLPFTLDSILLPGAMDDPAVRAAIESISPGVGPAGRHGNVVFRYNQTDQFVPGDMHVTPLAARYSEQGDNVTVITNHGQASPGHATMTASQLTALLTGVIPTGNVDTFNTPLEGMDKLTSLVIGGALTGIAEWGKVFNREAPAVLDEADRVITDFDRQLDQINPPEIPAMPQPRAIVPPVVPLAPVTPPQAAEQVVRALPSEVQEPVKAVLQSPEAQRVLEHPAVKQLTRDPLVQGALSLLPAA